MADLYKSREWLTRKYLIDKMKPEAIAVLCGVNEKTIRRYIASFGLKK
jgi:hypothetical protein